MQIQNLTVSPGAGSAPIVSMGKPEIPPPVVRQDLSIAKGEANPDGSVAWLLHDDVSGRYFKLNQAQIELLPYIDGRPDAEIAEAASAALHHPVPLAMVKELFTFLRTHDLVQVDPYQKNWQLRRQPKSAGILAFLLKSYLYYRIPLFRPDSFLKATYPYVAWLGHKYTINALIFIALLGLFLALSDFSGFQTTFLYFFNLQGLVYFTFALGLVKILHELGHGYAATAAGCRVSVMGVAMIFMWPVLYTDTTDAWKLDDRNKRLKIDAAGVAVELGIAAVALLAWSLTPEGPLRSVFFVLATSTWLLSLAVNLNPLMRFDGYYILSDYWRIPNLEPRSQELGRWWVREQLFGFGMPPPEPVQKRMIVYCLCLWVYRYLLFTGIALVVYHMFFKALGLSLFLAEIIFFIGMPVGREFMRWHDRREQFEWNARTIRTTVILSALLGLFFVPWSSTVSLPAIYQHGYQTYYAPMPGKIKSLNFTMGGIVEEGQLLMEIEAPELEFELSQAEHHLDELLYEQAATGIDAQARARTLISASELETQRQRLATLRAQVSQLSIKAQSNGRVKDTDPAMKVGNWVANATPLFSIMNSDIQDVFAYSGEAELGRLEAGQSGTFYPEGGGRAPFEVSLEEIDYFGVAQMEQLYSASTFGGNVAVRETPEGELIPTRATYRIRLQPLDPVFEERVLRGTVKIQAFRRSLAGRFWRFLSAIVIRESGF